VYVLVDPHRPDHSGALFIVTVYEKDLMHELWDQSK
jgi:hypothetical protein